MQLERSQQPAQAKSQTRLRPATQVTAVDRRRFPVLGYRKTTNGRPDQGNSPAAPINVPSLPNSFTTYKPAGSTTFSPDFTPSLLLLYSLPLHSPPPPQMPLPRLWLRPRHGLDAASSPLLRAHARTMPVCAQCLLLDAAGGGNRASSSWNCCRCRAVS